MGALSLSEIIDVNLSLLSAAVPQPAFSVDLILGSSARIANVVKYYQSQSALVEMASDGFLTSDPEYIRAAELIEQAIQPVEFAVACNAPASVTQINTVTISAVTSGDSYSIELDSETFSYTAGGGDTPTTVAAALVALINAAAPGLNVKASNVAGVITLTAWHWTIQVSGPTSGGLAYPGIGFSIVLGGTGIGQMSNVATDANVSLAAYLTTVQASDTGWYCVNICSVNWYDILNMAAAIEPQTLIFIASSADAAVPLSTCTADVLSILSGKGYNRTAYLYSGQAVDGADAGWTGTTIAIVPGASTWGNTAIEGITPDNLNASQFNAIAPPPGSTGGKNGNVYVTVGGNNVVLWGQAVSGRFLDITVGLDWLKSEIQGNVWASIVAARAAGSKIPYTNKGTSIFIGDVQEAINQGATNSLVDPAQPISVTAPDVSTQSLSARTNRMAPPIAFSCTLAGACSTAVINGVLSV